MKTFSLENDTLSERQIKRYTKNNTLDVEQKELDAQNEILDIAREISLLISDEEFKKYLDYAKRCNLNYNEQQAFDMLAYSKAYKIYKDKQ